MKEVRRLRQSPVACRSHAVRRAKRPPDLSVSAAVFGGGMVSPSPVSRAEVATGTSGSGIGTYSGTKSGTYVGTSGGLTKDPHT